MHPQQVSAHSTWTSTLYGDFFPLECEMDNVLCTLILSVRVSVLLICASMIRHICCFCYEGGALLVTLVVVVVVVGTLDTKTSQTALI